MRGVDKLRLRVSKIELKDSSRGVRNTRFGVEFENCKPRKVHKLVYLVDLNTKEGSKGFLFYCFVLVL